MRFFLTILFILLMSNLLIGGKPFDPFIYNDNTHLSTIGKSLWILEDSKNKLNVYEISQSNSFVKSTLETPNLNISNSTFWIRMDIKNNTPSSALLLELAHATIDEVEFYTLLPDSTFQVQKSGEYYNFQQRKYKHPNYIFDLYIPQWKTRTCFFKIRSGEQTILPIKIGTPQLISESISNQDLIFGIYCGVILVMFFYNLFLFFSVRDIGYLYYVVYVLLVGLTQSILKGYSFQYFWSNLPWLARNSTYLIPSLVGIAAIVFIKDFLQLKEVHKLYDKILNVIVMVYLFALALGLLGLFTVSQQIIQINVMIGSVFMLYVGIILTRKGNRSAKYFLIAWSFFLICICVFVLKTFGIVPHNTFTNYILEIGSALETILLSFALADKINTYKKERMQAIEDKERLLVEQNLTLDMQVKERTKELQHTLEKLQTTQADLIQAEKMSSLGQLTAGIAHEINNPLNYMFQGVEVVKEDMKDMKNLLDKYDAVLMDEKIDQEKIQDIKKYKEEIQIEEMYQEINRSLEDIADGIHRTESITKGLNIFSRLDEATLKETNIETNIDATLQLMKYELNKKEITIEKNYGEIPKIECNPGKLNQVFLNILNNAIWAIFNKDDKREKGHIFIQTKLEDNYITISFKDNGTGMSEETKNKIFDPFYTTKDVGEGTGLGMSIVHGIIQNHHGRIEVESELNKGTEIKIYLPIQ